jgi:diguanylate cyclase (GGDEF)-like protein
MFIRTLLIVIEVLFITILNYYVASSYYSLDVLYCLPVIQTARFSALQVHRNSDSQTLPIVAIFCAIAWSLAEAAVTWPNFPISAFLMNVVTRGVTFMVIGRVITKIWKDKEYSRKDWLTGLADRLEFIKWFEAKQLQSAKNGKFYSLLFFNIDRFKSLNEIHGHQMGDEALKILANTLRENSRGDDIASRIGGDEFVLLLPETDAQSCERLGARISLAAANKFNQNGWDNTLSYGHVSELGNKRSVDELLRAASEKMYLSKKSKQA